ITTTKKAKVRWKYEGSDKWLKIDKVYRCILGECIYYKTRGCMDLGMCNIDKGPNGRECFGIAGILFDNEEDFGHCGWAFEILEVPLRDYGLYRLLGGSRKLEA
ncbi:MAG: hypothetical protein GTN76_07190, partial [Candidatus Aenigmarchaeota archaeon]|nr:hypothetical protein [Candidatus Aenigmarchaeota archaeon]